MKERKERLEHRHIKTQTRREDSHVETEAEAGVMQL